MGTIRTIVTEFTNIPLSYSFISAVFSCIGHRIGLYYGGTRWRYGHLQPRDGQAIHFYLLCGSRLIACPYNGFSLTYPLPFIIVHTLGWVGYCGFARYEL